MTLTISAIGPRPFTYQWIKDKESLDCNAAVLCIECFTPENEGTYTCLISNAYENIESDEATLKGMLCSKGRIDCTYEIADKEINNKLYCISRK